MAAAPAGLHRDMSDVVHVPAQSRFELAGDDGEVAVLTYEEGEHDVAMLHTVVPPAMEGQGVGSRLVEAAVGWAREQGLAVVPVCSFVKDWLEREPA